MVKPEQFIEDAKLHIKSQLKGKGILACSGGQDSTLLSVIAGMVSRDILVIFVDTGLLRLHEVENAEKIFKKYNINYKIIDARQRFIQNLKGITDPEQKRKIVGKTFIDVFEEAAKDFGAEYLLQGTIAPDWIESGGQSRDTIKSHHNVGGLPENMKLKLIEPLRDLYKDEVREVSKYLGIPEIMPFPGPGLSIRIIGEVTEEKLDLIRKATDIVERNVMENMHERP